MSITVKHLLMTADTSISVGKWTQMTSLVTMWQLTNLQQLTVAVVSTWTEISEEDFFEVTIN